MHFPPATLGITGSMLLDLQLHGAKTEPTFLPEREALRCGNLCYKGTTSGNGTVTMSMEMHFSTVAITHIYKPAQMDYKLL